MVQKVKKSKKKVVSKPNASRNATKPASHDQQQSASSGEDELEPNHQNWTPIQLEQIELSRKLDHYIGGFQKKLLRLNFQPSHRELVILFIMNLHPRWRRMVEPVELSCSSWVEAAAFARLHCARVSAILGCEDRSDAIFKTSDSKALRDSGYFAPDDTEQKIDTPPPSISHLLKSEQQVVSDKSDTVSKSGSSSPPANTSKLAATATDVTSTAGADQKQPSNVPKRATDERIEVKSTAKASPSVSPSISHSSTFESSQTLKPKVTATAAASSSSSSSPSTSSSSSSSSSSTAKARMPAKNRKEKEKEKKAQSQLPQQKKQLDQMGTLLINVPKQHLDTNLTFLEFPIHGKKVKGLLAKLSWESSAISIDCANRLGLEIKPSDRLRINTDFGHVDSVGILTLPIHHPADPTRAKSEMDIQVLPMIYGGKVDLVLGADFFRFYNATLNIRTRAIRFLDKETPYTVEKLVE